MTATIPINGVHALSEHRSTAESTNGKVCLPSAQQGSAFPGLLSVIGAHSESTGRIFRKWLFHEEIDSESPPSSSVYANPKNHAPPTFGGSGGSLQDSAEARPMVRTGDPKVSTPPGILADQPPQSAVDVAVALLSAFGLAFSIVW